MQKLKNIMLIDDSKIDAKLSRITIRRSGINANIVELHSAEAALNRLQGEEAPLPQLIFLDINMPKMDGLAFLHAYRNLMALQQDQIVIVILTASANPAEQREALHCGTAKTVLQKPLTQAAIESIVQTYFN